MTSQLKLRQVRTGDLIEIVEGRPELVLSDCLTSSDNYMHVLWGDGTQRTWYTSEIVCRRILARAEDMEP